jgi:DNA-binding transcriptional MerR regulator
MSNVPPESQTAYFPIRIVSSETGVNAITLRAWERRYGLITPKRTEKGHRLYTADDILLIRKIVSLLNRGIPISQAQAMIANGEGLPDSDVSAPVAAPSQWQHYREALVGAVQDFDAHSVAALFTEVAQFFPVDVAVRFLYLPLYQQLRSTTSLTQGTARLRFFSGFLQARLAQCLYDGKESDGAAVIVANTGFDDDVELLFLALLLRQHGLRPVWFSGQMSASQLRDINQGPRWQASIIRTPSDASAQLLTELSGLTRDSGLPMFIAGLPSSSQPDLLERGMIWLQEDLHLAALTIRDMLTGFNS